LRLDFYCHLRVPPHPPSTTPPPPTNPLLSSFMIALPTHPGLLPDMACQLMLSVGFLGGRCPVASRNGLSHSCSILSPAALPFCFLYFTLSLWFSSPYICIPPVASNFLRGWASPDGNPVFTSHRFGCDRIQHLPSSKSPAQRINCYSWVWWSGTALRGVFSLLFDRFSCLLFTDRPDSLEASCSLHGPEHLLC